MIHKDWFTVPRCSLKDFSVCCTPLMMCWAHSSSILSRAVMGVCNPTGSGPFLEVNWQWPKYEMNSWQYPSKIKSQRKKKKYIYRLCVRQVEHTEKQHYDFFFPLGRQNLPLIWSKEWLNTPDQYKIWWVMSTAQVIINTNPDIVQYHHIQTVFLVTTQKFS